MSMTGIKENPGLREEVFNVKLAELLSRSGLLSVPESILSEAAGRRLPDIAIGNYWGVRVILEGRIADRANVEETLEKDCLKRIEEGIAAIAIAIIYPPELRHSAWATLERTLQTATFRIKVFSEAGRGEWIESDFDGLSAVLRRAYESLVHEDVVSAAVNELSQSIETTSRQLSGYPGTAERLRKLLVLPRKLEVDENEEQ
jgi:hypothetical protein